MTFTSGLRDIWSRHPLIVLSAPLAVALAVQAWLRTDYEWFETCVGTAAVLLRGEDIYSSGNGYSYPPFAALLAIPFLPLPPRPAALAFYAVNLVAVIVLIRAAWRIAGGLRLEPAVAVTRPDWWAFGLGLICVGPYILNALAHQQTDVIIAALFTAGCQLMLTGQIAWGAVLIGLAAAFKGPPLLFVGYLVFRRRWLAAGLMFAVAVGVNLLPDLIARPEHGTWLGRWLSGVWAIQSLDTPLGTWNAELFNIFNHSLAGTLQRVTSSVLVFGADGVSFAPRPAQVAASTMKAIAYSLMLALLVVSVAASVRGDRVPQGPVVHPVQPSMTAIEFGTVAILMLLISPMSGLAHFAILAIPVFCFARLAVFGGNRFVGAIMVVAACGALAVNRDLVGPTYDVVLWSGVPTIVALVLWCGGIFVLITNARAAPSPLFSRSIMDKVLAQRR